MNRKAKIRLNFGQVLKRKQKSKKNGEESALKPSLPRSIPNRLYSD